MQVAQQLGYAPHQVARSLISGRSDTIGLVLASPSNPFYGLVLEGFLQHFQRHNLRVMCYLAPTLDDVEIGMRAMLQYKVDAMIVAASGLTSEAVTDCRRNGVPVILFNRSISSESVPTVQTDNVRSSKMMAEFLVRGGHSSIAYVNGLEMSSTNRDRLRGFTEGLAQMGLEPPIQEYGDFSYEGGREAAKRLMMSATPPDAIFCANDVMALGVLDCLKNELGISVPDDVSVTGFDDIPMAGWSSFNLTTVRQRRTQMIVAAIDLLDQLLAGEVVEAPTVLIEGRLILRGSARLPSSLPS
ncbi:hypothetical protein DT23_12440 [Thioclava indica]|uniref:HTH lacI-type domain-containing protein n=2 Tax=Thioclava indica TaxID=1353528 RepID=A0A074KGS6_9RHOB|nr:hypothetical protein DT23_12440 [Thioclava indica]